MPFVVDASIAGAWLLPDEDNTLAEQAMMRMAEEDAVAPDLLRHEIRSNSAERREARADFGRFCSFGAGSVSRIAIAVCRSRR